MELNYRFFVFGWVGLLSACSISPQTKPHASIVITDPVAYCARQGGDDSLFEGKSTSSISALRKTYQLSPTASDDWIAANSHLRCMEHRVYSCFSGANIPCSSKIDLTKKPSAASLEFCRAYPNRRDIPIYVTGRTTAYQWGCVKGQPAIAKQLLHADKRGFIREFWQPLPVMP